MQADDSQAERGSPKRQRLSTPSEQDECASEVIAGPSSTPQDAAMDDKENADPAAVVEAGAATEDGVDQTNANGHKKVDKGKGREDDFVPVHGVSILFHHDTALWHRVIGSAGCSNIVRANVEACPPSQATTEDIMAREDLVKIHIKVMSG